MRMRSVYQDFHTNKTHPEAIKYFWEPLQSPERAAKVRACQDVSPQP
jgi:hypothetical protein